MSVARVRKSAVCRGRGAPGCWSRWWRSTTGPPSGRRKCCSPRCRVHQSASSASLCDVARRAQGRRSGGQIGLCHQQIDVTRGLPAGAAIERDLLERPLELDVGDPRLLHQPRHFEARAQAVAVPRGGLKPHRLELRRHRRPVGGKVGGAGRKEKSHLVQPPHLEEHPGRDALGKLRGVAEAAGERPAQGLGLRPARVFTHEGELFRREGHPVPFVRILPPILESLAGGRGAPTLKMRSESPFE